MADHRIAGTVVGASLLALITAGPGFAQVSTTAAEQGASGAVLTGMQPPRPELMLTQFPSPVADQDRPSQHGWSANRLMEARVVGLVGEAIGEVGDIVLAPDGQILSIVVSVDGFWEDDKVNVPWPMLEISEDLRRVGIPVSDATIDEDALNAQEYLGIGSAGGEILELEDWDDPAMGPRVWRATALIGDAAHLSDQATYGRVEDLIFDRTGTLQAIVVRPRTGEHHIIPFVRFAADWHPGLDRLELPYDSAEMEALDQTGQGED